MDEALQGLPNCRRVVDDVILFSNSLEEHLVQVRQLLSRCKEAGISLNLNKLQLAQPVVKFAGFIVSKDGYSPDPQLTTSISESLVASTVLLFESNLARAFKNNQEPT